MTALAPATEDALVALMRAVARDEILPRFRALDPGAVRAKSRADDLVTEADLAAEAAIGEGVRALLPDALVIGEEACAADPGLLDGLGPAELAVLVDPIDGTWNYAHGLAAFGVILAVTRRGETVFGLLYDPVLDDWVLARRGGGAWDCRPGTAPRRLELGAGPDTGDAAGMISPIHAGALRGGSEPISGRLSALGCSCQDYRLLTRGAVDFSVSMILNPWDHAAGALAVAEAGGVCGLLDGRAYAPTQRTGRMVAARTPALAETLRARLGRGADGPE